MRSGIFPLLSLLLALYGCSEDGEPGSGSDDSDSQSSSSSSDDDDDDDDGDDDDDDDDDEDDDGDDDDDDDDEDGVGRRDAGRDSGQVRRDASQSGGGRGDGGGAGPSGGGANTSRDAGVSPARDSGAVAPPSNVSTSGPEPTIPAPNMECPVFQSGTMMIMGQSVEIRMGPKSESGQGGPLVFYWHGTGGHGRFVDVAFPPAMTEEILSQGGLIVAPTTTTMQGMDVTVILGVFYTGDFVLADLIVACAVEQLNIDKRRIYTTGDSAGGLMSGAMLYGRSSYLAASVPNSGGIAPLVPTTLEDPNHVPPLMTLHGAMGSDVVIIDFAEVSATLDRDVAGKGGFVINCDHGGGHVAASPELRMAGWQFMKDHPFGVDPEPYADGLPAGFPDYCKIIQ